ncbi:YwdI family protein [Bacillus sp. SD088]|uniref:YwdI family protein n=1 Tax=Bacillus sp. SD088 TaxID=2782012 RepID=UPI001A967ACA|nr:YwdI family protein [Bacillus sp. SD088]MBO0991607.1 YwdI family protein [Bacillus sp. SD088]
MGVSYEVLLAKMQEEINKAKHASEMSTRKAHLYTVKTLAELGIGGEELNQHAEKKEKVSEFTPTFTQQTQSKPISIPQSEPIKTEDGANGDSIFDF